MIRIVTDSTADLPAEILERYQISVVPLLVTMEDKSYRDGIDITPEELFAMVDKTDTLPKTAAPSIVEFLKEFSVSEETLYIGLSSELSSTLQNAYLAKNELAKTHKVEIVDSRNLSSGIGMLVLQAAELREQGLSLEEIKNEIEKTVSKVKTIFVVDTLRYLHLGGRCSAMQSMVGGMLKVHPVICVDTELGKMDIEAKIRGNLVRAHRLFAKKLELERDKIDFKRIFVTHACCYEDAEVLRDEILAVTPFEELIINKAGCVIASHCGPGTFGIIYNEL